MTIPANKFFVMGDHRSISSDSREFGPVERELIYGKAAFVYWPMDQAGVVAQSYWDSGDAMSHTAALPVLTVNQQAYVAEFGHRPYTGSYWPRIIRVPAATLPH